MRALSSLVMHLALAVRAESRLLLWLLWLNHQTVDLLYQHENSKSYNQEVNYGI